MTEIKEQSPKDISIASAMLGNMIRAGIVMDEAVRHLDGALPNRGWKEVAAKVAHGAQLSECLVGLWPEAIVSAVSAGDHSGKLADVLKQVEAMMMLKKEISDALTQFYAPAAYLLGGIGTATFYMVSVIPSISRASKALIGSSYKPSDAMAVSLWFQDVFINHWITVCVLALGMVVGMIWLFQQPEFWNWLFEVADHVAVLDDALRKLYFGLWAKTLAMMSAAGGIDIIEMLTLSSRMLPENMRAGVLKMASEVERCGLSEAGDPRRQPDDDPRHRWPMYIGIAFVSAGQTGNIELEMNRIAPELIDEGMRSLSVIIKTSSIVAMALTGLLAGVAPALLIFEQGHLFQQTMSM